jgi:hypothetical protein
MTDVTTTAVLFPKFGSSVPWSRNSGATCHSEVRVVAWPDRATSVAVKLVPAASLSNTQATFPPPPPLQSPSAELKSTSSSLVAPPDLILQPLLC